MKSLDAGVSIGEQMYAFAAEMFPICRSITGDGVRNTLDLIKKRIPIEIHEVPTGTKVFDKVSSPVDPANKTSELLNLLSLVLHEWACCNSKHVNLNW